MDHLDLVVFGLLVTVAGLAVIARALGLPYAIMLVLGGCAIGFVPGVPTVELDPDVVLLLFLPFLLYGAAFFSSLRDLKANVRPIGLLAVGLVLATMLTVGAVGHFVIGLSWPVAFVLGAIVSPTDPVAPAEILRTVGAPRRIITVIEGESLINDWTALVLYKFAVAAVVTGSFSLVEATGEFVLNGVGGVAIGLVAGRIIRTVRPGSTTADRDHYLASFGLRRLPPGRGARPLERDRGGDHRHLHGLVHARADHGGDAHPEPVRLGGGHVPRERDPVPAHRASAAERDRRALRPQHDRPGRLGGVGGRDGADRARRLGGGTDQRGTRGVPARADPVLAGERRGGLERHPRSGRTTARTSTRSRRRACSRPRRPSAASTSWRTRTGSTTTRSTAPAECTTYRRSRFRARFDDDDDGAYEERASQYQRLVREVLDAERRALLELRNAGRISDEVRRRVERDFDLEESRLE